MKVINHALRSHYRLIEDSAVSLRFTYIVNATLHIHIRYAIFQKKSFVGNNEVR